MDPLPALGFSCELAFDSGAPFSLPPVASIERAGCTAVCPHRITLVSVGAHQLPPEIEADRLILRAERSIEEMDPEGALEAIQAISALQEEHRIELPAEVHWRLAQLTFSLGKAESTRDSVIGYLSAAGRDGEFYEEAMALLDDVDRILADSILLRQEKQDAPDCAGETEWTGCWIELANRPGCYIWSRGDIWNLGLTTGKTSWSGGCSSGFAMGRGTLTWGFPDGGRSQHRGTMRLGKKHGPWVIRLGSDSETAATNVAEGPYLDGEKNGYWVVTRSSSSEEGLTLMARNTVTGLKPIARIRLTKDRM